MNINSLNEEYLKVDGKMGTARITRKERDRQLREHDILTAAEHVFAYRGYHDATIQDIAKEAEYASGTIYLYFKDKEALYLALFEKKIQHFISLIKEKVKNVEGTNEKIKVLISEQLTYFKENQDFFRIYFSAREGIRWTIKDKLSASVVNKLMQYIDFIAGLIEKAQEEKIIRKDFEAKHLAFVLSSIMNTVIMGWFRPEPSKKEDLDDATTFVLDIFLSGARRKT